MRLATFRQNEEFRTGLVDDDRVIDLAAGDVGSFLKDPEWRERALQGAGPVHSLESLSLAPVVTAPTKIVCLGLNYRNHIVEMGRQLPEYPTLFTKFARALIGPRDPIHLPTLSQQVDWEAELAFVIGSPLRNASRAEAVGAIAGFTIMNDVSMRDWQNRATQWLPGKTWEAATPLGPTLVTPDEVDSAQDLEIRCEVDGELMQRARTSDLLFDPATVASYISQFVTLDPGDVISTGTPGGVGAAREPAVFLRPGQIVRTWIEGLGECENKCISPF